jgi:hypothetical protein
VWSENCGSIGHLCCPSLSWSLATENSKLFLGFFIVLFTLGGGSGLQVSPVPSLDNMEDFFKKRSYNSVLPQVQGPLDSSLSSLLFSESFVMLVELFLGYLVVFREKVREVVILSGT